MEDDKHVKWFEHWFDSPYYHILYKHRNHDEAELFIDNLLNFLSPKSNSRFLDVGCGKGRHSIYLNKKGYDVTGIDLSPESIAYASQFENESLHFFAEDMRKINRIDLFDYVLNLFTSFGYFENDKDDYATINCLSKSLKTGGIFVLDFMNVQKVISDLIPQETKISEGIEFKITRHLEKNFIIKNIQLSDTSQNAQNHLAGRQGKEYTFQERVKMLTITDFKKYFAASKLKIVNLLGDYELNEFNPETSERLIIIAQKD